MNGIIYKLPSRYLIVDADTREIVGSEHSAYRAGQEASNLGFEENKLCIGWTGLSIIPTADLALLSSSGSVSATEGSEKTSPSGSSSQPSGPQDGGTSSRRRRRKSGGGGGSGS